MILLVIHETEVGEDISQGLRARGYQVSCSQDAEEALTLVSQTTPSIILIDLYLKDPSGLEVLRKLRTQGYKGKVILLSGMSVSTEIPEAFSWGVDHIVSGPLTLDQLDCAIRSVLGSAVTESPFPPQ